VRKVTVSVVKAQINVPDADRKRHPSQVNARMPLAGTAGLAIAQSGTSLQMVDVMLSVDRVIAAPPSDVWKLLIDLEAWPKWGLTVRRAELDPPLTALALHATGTVETPLLVSLPFVITEFDAGKHWAWTVAGVPATRHRVEPWGDGARVTIAVPWWSAAYLAVCAIALRRIDEMLTAQYPL
jgi:hypothetical protein